MPHIHELIDFTVSAYLVHKDKVLMVHHRGLDIWVPVGGHIELNEDTDQALLREINEECGLTKANLEFTNNRPEIPGAKFLLQPQYVDIHEISKQHRHLNFTYFVKAKNCNTKLSKPEHSEIKWFSLEELEKFDLRPNIRFLTKEALRVLSDK